MAFTGKGTDLIRLRRTRWLAWLGIVCLVHGWTHIALHALGGEGTGHFAWGPGHAETFAHISDAAVAHDHHGFAAFGHADHPCDGVHASEHSDHRPQTPSDPHAGDGDQCFLAKHPPTTLCPLPSSAGQQVAAQATQPVPNVVRGDHHSFVFPIRAPPIA